MFQNDKVAVFTTVYPEGLKFLFHFFNSISEQIDRNFDLWIGLDRINEEDLIAYELDRFRVIFVKRAENESNISLRRRTIELMIENYYGIIFVDSDDILAPARVSISRSFLKTYDLYGCAMKIINEDGTDMNNTLRMPPGTDLSSLIPRFNIFGLSNTSYSTSMLHKCLPFPDDCLLLDWFLSTRAWFHGAKIYFDPMELMSYRQWSLNTARVVPPFTPEQILISTELVLQHYHFVLTSIPEISDSNRNNYEKIQSNIKLFYDSINQYPIVFQEYIQQLNQLRSYHIWWTCVAHPELESIWKKEGFHH
jgi:hypothetical protein